MVVKLRIVNILSIVFLTLLLSGCALFGSKMQEFTVYRVRADGTETLLPEKIQMQDNGKSLAENAINHLINVRPIDDQAYTDNLPDGVKLLGITVDQGIAYVDFSKEVSKRTMGSYEATMFIGSIVNTLTEIPGIKAVQILIEGKKRVMYCGVLDIEEPLLRNESLLPQVTKK